jgi:hypothetical protein
LQLLGAAYSLLLTGAAGQSQIWDAGARAAVTPAAAAATWYTLAIAASAGLGALVGGRLRRW